MPKFKFLKPLATALVAFLGGSGLFAAEYTLPFEQTASQSLFDNCVVIDTNNDSYSSENGKWTYNSSSHAFKYAYHNTNKGDDWLIFPKIDFGTTTQVTITFNVQTSSGPESLEVFLGQDQTAEAMTIPVLSRLNFTVNGNWEPLTATINVPQNAGSNEWCLGFHAISDADQYWIYIKDFVIEAATGEVTVVPAAPVIKDSKMDFLNYSATVQIPELDTAGETIADNMTLKVLVDNDEAETYADLAPGAEQKIALTLEEGEHTIGYQVVLNDVESSITTEKVTAAPKVIVPASPVVSNSNIEGKTYKATVTMPSQDTNGDAISGTMSLTVTEGSNTLKTYTDLAAGAQVDVELTLAVGTHTLKYTAILDNQSSQAVEDEVFIDAPTYTLPFTFAPDDASMSECIVIDANGDGGNQYSAEGKWTISEGAFCYTYNQFKDADDWVILPSVNFGNATKVKISVAAKTGAYPEGFELWLGNQRTISAMTTKVTERTDFMAKDGYETIEATIDVPASADNKWALGIHAVSEADKYTLFIKDISIVAVAEDNLVPQAPVISGSKVEELVYSATVKMPESTVTGDQIADQMTLKVLVDSEVALTKTDVAAGAEIPVELTLTAGTHTVEAIAVLNGIESAPASEKVTAKGPEGGMGSLPYTFTVTQESFNQCEVFDVNNDGQAESSYKNGMWSYGSTNVGGALKYTYSSDNAADDWIILPMVNFGDCTDVTVYLDVMTEADAEAFSVHLGNDRTVEAMTVPVLSRANFTHANTFETLSATVKVPAGEGENDWCVGIHVTSPANRYLLYVNNIRIEKATGAVTVIPALPVVKESNVENLSYTATVQLPDLDTAGEELQGNLSLRVYVDNKLTKTLADLEPGSEQEIALSLEEGEHTIGYQAVLNGVSGDLATETVTAAVKVIVPASPVVSGSIIDKLTYTATVVMPSKDTAGNDITGTMSLVVSEKSTTLKTIANLAAGAEVEVELTLSIGTHNLEFAAVLGDETSEPATDTAVIAAPTYDLPFTFAPSLTTMSQCVVIDANRDASGNDGKWSISNDAFCYNYSSNDADDWVILPTVDFGKASKVKISLSAKTGKYPEAFEIWLGNQRTAEGMTLKVAEQTSFISPEDYRTIEATIDVPESTDNKWALGLHAVSKAEQLTLFIKDIEIVEVIADHVIPAAPVFANSTIDGMDYSTTITMPETTVTGANIEDKMTLKVLVDSEVVLTKTDLAAGAEIPVELTLEAGTHTVEAIAVLNDVESQAASEKVTVKLPELVTGSLPYKFTVNQETFAQCLVVDVNKDGQATTEYKNGMWSYAILSEGGAMKYTYSEDNQADDWIILPLVDFGESKAVTVSLNVMTQTDSEDFEVYLGRERSVDAMTVVVAEYKDYTHPNSFETLTKTVTLPAAESRADANEWCLGIHASSPAAHFAFYVNNIEIKGAAQSALTDIEAEADEECEYYNLQGIRIANPTPGTPVIVRKGNQTYKTIIL